jgi:hypothetical protein
MSDRNVIYLITHSRLIDGFGELSAARYYVPYETSCGICDAPFTVHPRIQKYILEIRQVPVKVFRDGGVFCVPCRKRRSRITWLHRHDRWRTVPDGAAERERLRQEEYELKRRSHIGRRDALWPYPYLSAT